ncbi:DUF2064 domain-containing protein [Tenacibaculum sp. 190524A02b]|uniref:DUF2064 domain-containing protein n=1 Tax=Tenacibaculum vairaonense TaxID=3137860 RepID=UPI0031FB6FD4
MPHKQNDVAVLIFANSSSQETKQKSLPQGSELFDYLNHRVIQVAKKTSFDIVLFDETLQKGKTFGERFTNAIETIFAKGYHKVIAIGNDSPDLKTKHLKKAFTQLDNQQSVLGPSLDGGAYLIAFHKKHFNKQQFLQLPWQTNLLFTTLHQLLLQHTKVTSLTYLKDIDSFDDLKYFLFRFNTERILHDIIRKIIYSFKIVFYYFSPIQKINYPQNIFNKGSPTYLSL